jgi:hypothetical protein
MVVTVLIYTDISDLLVFVSKAVTTVTTFWQGVSTYRRNTHVLIGVSVVWAREGTAGLW